MAAAYTADDRAAQLAAAKAALARALYFAPSHAFAYLILGRVEIYSNHGLQAIAECERALALDRNLAAAHATIGMAKMFIGRGEETEGHIREALRISPRDTLAFNWLATAGLAKLYLGRDEEAVDWFRRAIGLDRRLPNAPFYLAAALAHLGRLDEANASLANGFAFNPSYTISSFRAGSFSDHPEFPASRVHV